MKYQDRQNLNKLSKMVYGSSSRWQKMVNNGVPELFERDRQAVVPHGGTLKTKTFTDHKYVMRHYTVDEVIVTMMDILKKSQANQKTIDTNIEDTLGKVENIDEVVETIFGPGAFEGGTQMYDASGKITPETFADLEKIRKNGYE